MATRVADSRNLEYKAPARDNVLFYQLFEMLPFIERTRGIDVAAVRGDSLAARECVNFKKMHRAQGL